MSTTLKGLVSGTKGWIALAYRAHNLFDIIEQIRQRLFDTVSPPTGEIIGTSETFLNKDSKRV